MKEEPAEICYNCKKNETNLRCQKCDELICYKCSISTPVGYRCTKCVSFNKLPMYKISNIKLIITLLCMIPISVLSGIISTILIPSMSYYNLISMIVCLVYGLVISQIIFYAINKIADNKRGKKLQCISLIAISMSLITRAYITNDFNIIINDINALIYAVTANLILWEKFK
jgi:hypothetical protein